MSAQTWFRPSMPYTHLISEVLGVMPPVYSPAVLLAPHPLQLESLNKMTEFVLEVASPWRFFMPSGTHEKPSPLWPVLLNTAFQSGAGVTWYVGGGGSGRGAPVPPSDPVPPELVAPLEPELAPPLEPELPLPLEPELVPPLEPELDPPPEPEPDPPLELVLPVASELAPASSLAPVALLSFDEPHAASAPEVIASAQ